MKRLTAAACILLFLLLPSCGQKAVEETVFSMDTAVVFKLSGQQAADALSQAEQELDRLEALLDADGELLTTLAETGEVENAELAALLSRALSIGEKTGGALDVTLYPAIRLWGFIDRQYRVPSADELEAVRPLVDYRRVAIEGDRISLPSGFSLTLGAVAKGYAGDRLAAVITSAGVESGILSLGGNVRLIGSKNGSPFTVAVRAPSGGNALTLALTDTNIVTSGGYERYFEQNGEIYHHILDPDTLSPARSTLTSVTVVSADGTLADALSTALFVMGLEEAMDYYAACGASDGFEVVLLTDAGEAYLSSGLRQAVISVDEAYTARYFGA